MSEDTQELRRISWSECFGFSHLFRAFRLAIHPTKLMLAFCGLLLTYGTGRVMDVVWPASDQAAYVVMGGRTLTELDVFLDDFGGGREATQRWLDEQSSPQRMGTFKLLLNHGRVTLLRASDAVLAADLGGVVAAVRSAVMAVVWLLAMHPVFGLIFLLLGLAYWAFFGGALCRVAALHSARDERIGLGESLAFAKKKWTSFVAAPLMPVAVVVLFAVLLLLGGLVGAIPAVGEILVGILFFLALIAGFIIAFVVIGMVAGFPLTFPTVAIEGSDAFDALSRSFSYIYQRPWRSVLYGLVSVVYGAICLVFVKLFVRIMLCSVHLIVGWTMDIGSPYLSGGTEAGQEISKLDAMWQGPSLSGETPFWGGFAEVELAHVSAFGRVLFCLWIFLIVGLVGSFVVSLYYCASTQIYFLLRREVDATAMEEVYLEEGSGEEDLPLPEAGVPPVDPPDALPGNEASESGTPSDEDKPDTTSPPDAGQAL